jgi:hypothetical protein
MIDGHGDDRKPLGQLEIGLDKILLKLSGLSVGWGQDVVPG